MSCVFLTGYTAYTVYAVYYYRTFANALSIALLVLIAVAFALSATITFLSYRINLKDAPRPKLHRFIKMAKYLPFLIWGFFVNVIVEYFDRKFIRGFGKKVYIPAKPLDDEGNEIDMTRAIAEINGVSAAKKAAGKNSRGKRI